MQPCGLIRTPNAPKNCEQKTVTSKRPTVQGNEESDTYKSFPSFTERALVPSGWICFLRRVALAHSFACSSTPIQYSCICFFSSLNHFPFNTPCVGFLYGKFGDTVRYTLPTHQRLLDRNVENCTKLQLLKLALSMLTKIMMSDEDKELWKIMTMMHNLHSFDGGYWVLSQFAEKRIRLHYTRHTRKWA